MKKTIAIFLFIISILSLAACKKENTVFQATIIEVRGQAFLVEPIEGSQELNSADRIEVPIKNMDPSPAPEVGDVLEITYNGEISESYPAQLSEVYSVKVVKKAEK